MLLQKDLWTAATKLVMTHSIGNLWELLLGLPHSLLSERGDWALRFNSPWPKIPLINLGQLNWLLGLVILAPSFYLMFSKRYYSGIVRVARTVALLAGFLVLLMLVSGPIAFNLTLGALVLLLVVKNYSFAGPFNAVRMGLGVTRLLLFGLILFLLNKPAVTVIQSEIEPSVLAILIDDSASMRVPDVINPSAVQNVFLSRLSAVRSLLTSGNGAVLKQLAARHNLRLYKFDRDAISIASVQSPPPEIGRTEGQRGLNHTSPVAANQGIAAAVAAVRDITSVGDSTQVLPSILTVLRDLQGQRVAGVVLLTDGRDTPARNIAEELDALRDFGVKVFPIAVGSDREPKNIQVQSIELDDVAFKGDIVNVKAMVRVTGYEPNHAVHLMLRDNTTKNILLGREGKPAEVTIRLLDDKPVPVELQWQPTEVGNKQIEFVADRQAGELDETDNARQAMVSVLDAKITVLFVDGYPRWDYRYLKNALMRDKTVEVSCLLASADFSFLQEGNKPLPSAGANIAGHFPDTLEQLMQYDVIVLGDVDPHYFSDNQLQLINEFVDRGGGFEMVAGERFAPQAYRNTAIEPLLPISLTHVETTDPTLPITRGYRPMITKVGDTTTLFRFFADQGKNTEFIAHQIPEQFWYCRGVTAKPGVGEVLAEHPTDLGPDGHKAPLLVAGRYGGRTLFSAMDDSWRWRFYTDEPVFDTYWVQQLRYLARNRKIGQRRLTFTTFQPVYELGGQVRLSLRVIDPGLSRQLPDQLRVEVRDAGGRLNRMENLVRQDGSGETFAGSYTADTVGKFTVHLPPIVSGVELLEVPVEVTLPGLELNDPRVDRLQLSRLAAQTLGKPIELTEASRELAEIPSVKREEPKPLNEPLWNAPIVMAVFVLLIAGEWVVRKLNGMV
jgi:uncharacterized membrane protein